MRIAIPACLTLAALAAGCGASSIKGSTAEEQIKASNAAYKKVVCPKDITANKGARFTCTASTKKGDYIVTLQIDSLDGGQAHLSFVGSKKQSH